MQEWGQPLEALVVQREMKLVTRVQILYEFEFPLALYPREMYLSNYCLSSYG